jgi:hypothetical protein
MDVMLQQNEHGNFLVRPNGRPDLELGHVSFKAGGWWYLPFSAVRGPSRKAHPSVKAALKGYGHRVVATDDWPND